MGEADMKLKELNNRLEELKLDLERLARRISAIQIILHVDAEGVRSNHDIHYPPASD